MKLTKLSERHFVFNMNITCFICDKFFKDDVFIFHNDLLDVDKPLRLFACIESNDEALLAICCSEKCATKLRNLKAFI